MSPQPSAGLLRATFDTRFRYLVTPALLTWIYRACMAVIAAGTVFGVMLAIAVSDATGGWVWAVAGLVMIPMGGFIVLLICRVICEIVLSWFTHGRFTRQ